MQTSCGLLLFRRRDDALEVMLVHPGGPFFARKDLGAWTIPKGLLDAGEEPLDAAKREFCEETGFACPAGPFFDLGEVRQKSGKRVRGFACEGDADPAQLQSNTFEMEWPRGSGRIASFPEVDRGDWFSIETARTKIINEQTPFLDALVALLADR